MSVNPLPTTYGDVGPVPGTEGKATMGSPQGGGT